MKTLPPPTESAGAADFILQNPVQPLSACGEARLCTGVSGVGVGGSVFVSRRDRALSPALSRPRWQSALSLASFSLLQSERTSSRSRGGRDRRMSVASRRRPRPSQQLSAQKVFSAFTYKSRRVKAQEGACCLKARKRSSLALREFKDL